MLELARRWIGEAAGVDKAVYEAVAGTPTPTMDRTLSELSRAADYSRLTIAVAGMLAIGGGRTGRRAAGTGLISVAVTSAVMNAVIKPLVRRPRPAQDDLVTAARQIPMPRSASFPSGHSASAFAFATGVGQVLPSAAFPLRGLGALVAYSRVHTGVHYPGDVIAGALLGDVIAQASARALERRGFLERRRDSG
jgi:membrane-associated phospholipid phosphatase